MDTRIESYSLLRFKYFLCSDATPRKEKRMYASMRTRAPIGTKQRTGEVCKESGVWKVDDLFSTTTAPIAKGNRIPPYRNRAVTWILVQYA